MKKQLCIILSLLLCLGVLCACEEGKSNISDTSVQSEVSNVSSIPEESLIPEESVVPDENSEVLEELPPLPDDEAETVVLDDDDYVYGKITEKWSNALTLKLDTPRMIEEWGEYVYIITDEGADWCVGDEIEVLFTEAKRPDDTTKYVYITADEVMPLLLYGKPIIYLYPQAPTVCSVFIELDGVLTCTYPAYADGWQNFTANPDGTLIFPDGKEYYALYWEGVRNTEWDFSKGFCVAGEDTAAFLEWALASQGLTPREANEFIVYWLPVMQNNPYNVISFQTDAYVNTAELKVYPEPDSLLRVFMAFYPSDEIVDIPFQSFEPFVRQGFTVVEWGGSEVK